MHWVMSDIHGCLDEYRELLGRLALSGSDTLYVLGDAIDRGPASAAVLRDVLSRRGIIYIPGNHDYFLHRLGPRYGFSRAEGRVRRTLFDRALYAGWMLDGGRSTLEQFRMLPSEERRRILRQLEAAPACLEVEAAGHTYVLVHKAVSGFEQRLSFSDWKLRHFLQKPADFRHPCFIDGRTVVSGHTWTAEIRRDGRSEIYADCGHLAIDCGCVFGGRLAAHCLETGKTLYAESRQLSPGS